jgi:hypothetical protein
MRNQLRDRTGSAGFGERWQALVPERERIVLVAAPG